jgi:hypothetical protein
VVSIELAEATVLIVDPEECIQWDGIRQTLI